MPSLAQIRACINPELKRFETHFGDTLHTGVKKLDLMTWYMMRGKGKLVRPMLVLLSAKLFKPIDERVYVAASLVELLHTASLIHDDVVDASEQRRGLWSHFAIWKSKTSVLFGDYLLARGLRLAVEHNAHDLLRIASIAVDEMCQGELHQMDYTRKATLSQEEYFSVIQKKTGALISACTESGAASASASAEDQARLKEFGSLLGMIFQIRDDMFDYQSSSIIGKPNGMDIREGKITLPLICALKDKPKAEQKQIIKTLRSKSLKLNDKIKQVTDFVLKNKGLEACQTIMQDLARQATDCLQSFEASEAKQALLDILQYSIERKK